MQGVSPVEVHQLVSSLRPITDLNKIYPHTNDRKERMNAGIGEAEAVPEGRIGREAGGGDHHPDGSSGEQALPQPQQEAANSAGAPHQNLHILPPFEPSPPTFCNLPSPESPSQPSNAATSRGLPQIGRRSRSPSHRTSSPTPEVRRGLGATLWRQNESLKSASAISGLPRAWKGERTTTESDSQGGGGEGPSSRLTRRRNLNPGHRKKNG